jgi:hypothetical protein
MRGMGMTATGVIMRVQGSEYGMHAACADDLIAQLAEAGYSAMDADMPAVIIGPLFADAAEWTCAHSACKVSA